MATQLRNLSEKIKMQRNAIIELKNIKKSYEKGDEAFWALDGINLDIRENDYMAIVGSSGSGKSTLMNLLGCLDYPTAVSYTHLRAHETQ